MARRLVAPVGAWFRDAHDGSHRCRYRGREGARCIVGRRAAGDRRLINVSSGAAAHPLAGGGRYCLGKAGLEMLTRVVAAEQGADGVTAITIRPGIIDTPMQTYMRGQSRERMPVVDMFVGFHADGQLVPPEVTAAKLVDALAVAAVEPGRTYSYAEL